MKTSKTTLFKMKYLINISALILSLGSMQAYALPSFARQTGMDCAGCHVGGFGPQMTPAGIKFKLTGYTDSDGQPNKVPLSGMVIGSWSHTKANQDPPPDHMKSNNNLKIDEASVFLAGKLTEHIGAFVQVTHNGVDHSNSLDQTDIRYARSIDLGGKETIFGVSVNNNPGVQDPFNTMPTWSFPYTSSPAGFGAGGTSSLINGGLEGRVIGTSVYAFFDNSLYGELGTYQSMSPTTQMKLGLGKDQQRLGGNTYWRLGWMQDMKGQAFHAGLFGWNALVASDRTASSSKDKFRDIGIDASYQFLGTREHVATVSGSYVSENKQGASIGDNLKLKESRINASYYFNQTWGATLGIFSTHGTDLTASTKGQLIQVDWTPWGKENATAPNPFNWANLRLGTQYWMYNKFSGDSASAKDHNTLYVFAWTSF